MSSSNEMRTLSADTLEAVILNGDLSRLNPRQKVEYVVTLCQRVGLDPATQPFKLMKLNGKEIAYADRSCAAQLNKLHGLSHQITDTQKDADSILMIDRCTGPDGRYTEEIGAVSLTGLKGEALANAIMKCRTKAMRRSTLTHVGLGMLDETEVETIPGAKAEPIPVMDEWTQAEIDDARVQMMTVADMLMDSGIPEAKVQEAVKKASGAINSGECGYSTFVNRVNGMCDRMIVAHRKASADATAL